jgi:hypothetical protein
LGIEGTKDAENFDALIHLLDQTKMQTQNNGKQITIGDTEHKIVNLNEKTAMPLTRAINGVCRSGEKESVYTTATQEQFNQEYIAFMKCPRKLLYDAASGNLDAKRELMKYLQEAMQMKNTDFNKNGLEQLIQKYTPSVSQTPASPNPATPPEKPSAEPPETPASSVSIPKATPEAQQAVPVSEVTSTSVKISDEIFSQMKNAAEALGIEGTKDAENFDALIHLLDQTKIKTHNNGQQITIGDTEHKIVNLNRNTAMPLTRAINGVCRSGEKKSVYTKGTQEQFNQEYIAFIKCPRKLLYDAASGNLDAKRKLMEYLQKAMQMKNTDFNKNGLEQLIQKYTPKESPKGQI